MKKICLCICLIIVFNIFSSCGVSDKDDNKSTGKKPKSSQTAAVSSIVSESSSEETATSSVASSENNNNISSAANSTSISKTSSADVSSLVVSKEESNRASLPIKKYFHYSGDSAEYEFLRFMAGIETPDPRRQDVSESEKIRDWAISQGEILIQVEKNRDEFYCKAYYNVPGNRSFFHVDTFGYKINDLYFRPLKKSERKMELKDLAKKYRFNNEDKMVKGKEKLKWGEYYTCVSTSKNECMYLIFRFDDYLITFLAPWAEAYTELIEYDEMLERVENWDLEYIDFEEYFKDNFFLNKSSKIKDS